MKSNPAQIQNFRVSRWFIGGQQVTQEEYQQNIIRILSGSERFKETIKSIQL